MSRVLFSVWFSIQGIIQNTTCSVWFRIQRIIKKNVQGIIQRLDQYLGYYSKYDLQRLVQDSAYYQKMFRVLFSVWVSIQGIIQNTTCSVWFRIRRIIQTCAGYYSASGSVCRLLFKIRPAASGSGFSVLFKNVQGIIQCLVHYSGYYLKYDLQRLVQDSA